MLIIVLLVVPRSSAGAPGDAGEGLEPLIGRRLKVFWEMESAWYKGTVDAKQIVYDGASQGRLCHSLDSLDYCHPLVMPFCCSINTPRPSLPRTSLSEQMAILTTQRIGTGKCVCMMMRTVSLFQPSRSVSVCSSSPFFFYASVSPRSLIQPRPFLFLRAGLACVWQAQKLLNRQTARDIECGET